MSRVGTTDAAGRDERRDAAALADRPEVLRFHATLAGRGEVYDGEQRLAAVEYLLKDVEEIVDPTTPIRGENSDALLGPRTLYGVFRSPEMDALAEYVGTRLALRLDDGRLLPFTISKVLRTGRRGGYRIRALLVRGYGDAR